MAEGRLRSGESPRTTQMWGWMGRLASALVVAVLPPLTALAVTTWADVRAHLSLQPGHEAEHDALRVFRLEGKRFSALDWEREKSNLREMMDRTYERVNHPPHEMPEWLREDIQEIKATLKDQEAKLDKVQADIQVIKKNGTH